MFQEFFSTSGEFVRVWCHRTKSRVYCHLEITSKKSVIATFPALHFLFQTLVRNLGLNHDISWGNLLPSLTHQMTSPNSRKTASTKMRKNFAGIFAKSSWTKTVHFITLPALETNVCCMHYLWTLLQRLLQSIRHYTIFKVVRWYCCNCHVRFPNNFTHL